MSTVDLDLLGEGLRKVLASGLNRAGGAAKKQFFIEISKKFGISESNARRYGWKRIKITKATKDNLRVVLRTGKGRRGGIVPLIAFSPEHSHRMPGASVEINRGKREIIPGTFIQKGRKSGRFSVFKRIGQPRYPITTVPGVPIEQMFIDVAPMVDKIIKATLDKYILSALTKEIKDGQI